MPGVEAFTSSIGFNIKEVIENNLADLKDMDPKKGTIKIVNPINFRPLSIDLKKLYKDSPRDYELAPNHFDTASPQFMSVPGLASARVINLEYEKADGWDLATYNKYFPGATKEDMPMIQSVLTSLGFPIASLIY
jgi:hypothetical protein